MFILSSDTLRALVTKSTQGLPPHRARRNRYGGTRLSRRTGPFPVGPRRGRCTMIPTAECLGRRKVMPSSVSRRFCC